MQLSSHHGYKCVINFWCLFVLSCVQITAIYRYSNVDNYDIGYCTRANRLDEQSLITFDEATNRAKRPVPKAKSP
jgi:hypothetical protein